MAGPELENLACWHQVKELNGWVSTFAEAEEVRRYFETKSSLCFVGHKKSPNFGYNLALDHHDAASASGRSKTAERFVRFADHKEGIVDSAGIPFMVMGKYTLDCVFGRDKHKVAKQRAADRRKTELQDDHPRPTKTRKRIQPSKKKGCPAEITMKEVILFPEFQSSKQKRYARDQKSKEIRQAISSGKPIKMEHRIYIQLPSAASHQNTHSLGPLVQEMASLDKGQRSNRLLIVGLACVDIINVAKEYPTEDTDQRLLDQRICRGGNASNTSVVLSQLGSVTEWLGTIASDKLADVIIEDLDAYGVMYDHAPRHKNCVTPLSCVIINDSSGSRTILHKNKTLPEVDMQDFESLDLGTFSWFHFEGRNEEKVMKMIEKIEEFNERRGSDGLKPAIVSVEAEKISTSRDFLHKGDYVFISKDYSMSMGYHTAEDCLKGVKESHLLKKGARAICAWGEKGAWGLEKSGRIVHSPAFPPIRVVDTLGAGDTFNAGVLHALNRGKSLKEALKLGCKVAGQKVGQNGFKIDTKALGR